jgi:hypothetical protein
VFHRSSFKTASFKPASWRFPDEAPEQPQQDLNSGGADPRRRTDFSDDELIEFAIALITSGALDG